MYCSVLHVCQSVGVTTWEDAANRHSDLRWHQIDDYLITAVILRMWVLTMDSASECKSSVAAARTRVQHFPYLVICAVYCFFHQYHLHAHALLSVFEETMPWPQFEDPDADSDTVFPTKFSPPDV